MPNALAAAMSNQTIPVYQVDARWKIVRANDAFCRIFRCTEWSLIGRDVRDLLREDWRRDFRSYVVRALVGVGNVEVTLPLVAPCGEQGWFRHQLEPLMEDGLLAGYRASIQPQVATKRAEPKRAEPKRWWRPTAARQVWDFEADQLATAG